jgi:DNA repair photolyase
MYRESIESWNPFVGCGYNCVYCESSFKRQMKRRKRHCMSCYSFKPHFHAERLSKWLPRTEGNGFIFCCDMGDVAFCRPEWMRQILTRIKQLPDRTFLIQSKNPNVFNNYRFPENVLLGTTIETNRDDLYEGISRAPLPSQRYRAMLTLQHPRKIVTIEPVLDFDVEIMERWVREIRSEICYVGYDSKKNYLPEPELQKVKVLMKKLKETTSVRAKTMRKAWWSP